MALTLIEIERIKKNLANLAPELRAEVEALVADASASKRPAPVEYVEVTHSDGTTSVVAAADYQRMTAMDLAHTKLRILSAAEAKHHGRGKEQQ